MSDTRAVMLAPDGHGGLYPIQETGAADAPFLRVCVDAHPFINGRAKTIISKYFPKYRADGVELHLYGKLKTTKAKGKK